MRLHRTLTLSLSIAALLACQKQEAAAPTEAAPAETVAPAEDMPVQEPSPDEVDHSAVPDYAWTLPDDAARVLGTANVDLAGVADVPTDLSQSSPPVAIDTANASTIQFPVVEGLLSCAGGTPSDGPDGAQCVSPSSDIHAANGFSASKSSNRVLYLAGVFPFAPDSANEVEAYTAPESDTETHVAPKANPVFLIGDGKTADGQRQTFVKPEGATTLYLGFADSYGFSGPPAAYDDNNGHRRFTFALDPK